MRYKSAAPWLTALLIGLCDPAGATPIAISNPGFESSPTSGVNTGNMPGWTGAGSGFGWWNINVLPLAFWSTTAPEGSQVAFVGRDTPADGPASIAQVLGVTLQAGGVYTLTGQVGHPMGFGASRDPDTLYTVELLVGNSVVSTISGTGPEGSFMPFQLVFDSAGSPLIGQALQIRLSSSQTQTAFDDIKLDVAGLPSVPEPSTLLLLLSGAFGLWKLAGRRTSKMKPL